MADSKTSSAAPQDSEHDEPGDMNTGASGMEAPPMWMWGIIFVALFAGVFFLGANLGNIGPDPWPKAAMAGGDVVPVDEPALDGAPIYANRCAVCHQADGAGIPGTFPPLSNSEWVTGSSDNVVRVVLTGLQGPIDVAGQSYNSAMPGLAAQLSDEEIAAVSSHIRNSFGNSASSVSAADVARIRGEGRTAPWSAEELEEMGDAAPAASTPAPTPVVAAAPPPTQTPATAASDGSDGAALFSKYSCLTCHAVDGPAAGAGPSLYDVGSRLTKGEIYQSIADPDAVIVDGYAPGAMSAMLATTNFTVSELNEMVNYLAGLKG